MLKKYIAKSLVVFAFCISLCAAATNSLNCHTINTDEIILHTQQTKIAEVYYLHNFSKYTVLLNHSNNGRGASAGWGSMLHANNWSMIAISKPNFSLTCQIDANGQYQTYSCARLIKICIPRNNSYLPKNNSKWIKEDRAEV